jgi:acyl carrier protein
MNDGELLCAVREAIGAVLEGRGPRPETIADDATLRELGLDSLGMMEVAGILEDRVGCELYDNDLERAERVRDLVALLRAARPPLA